MKTQKLYLIAILLLFIGGALAQVTEGNYFKYGEIDADGNVIGSINPIENVSVIGFVCENENCDSVSKRLWNNILNTITNYIELIYPTYLLSPNGYGIYMFKPGYIPFEVHATWAGNGDAGDYDNYLTKKQLCVSKIEALDVSYDGENIKVDAFVNSPLKSFGPLNYIPAEIEEYYKTNVILNLKVYQNSILFYEETKSKNILPSQGNFGFSIPADEGLYKIKITTSVDDLKCLDFEEDTQEKNIEISIDECHKDEDCNEDYNSEAYCLENDIFKNFHDFSCVQGVCKENVIKSLLNECFNGCIYGECIMECSIDADCGNDFHSANYCLKGDVYNDFHDFVCDHNQCFEDTLPELVKKCIDGCANGDCITPEEPYCGDGSIDTEEECDDGNLINEDGCDQNCILETCSSDDDCPDNTYSDRYCARGDAYRDFTDYFCNESCSFNITKKLIEECNYGCSNGECQEKEEDDEDDGGDDDRRKRTNKESEDEIFDSSAFIIPFIDYSYLDTIDLSTKADTVSKKIPFWLWILAALIVLLVLILLILTYRKI